MKFKTIILLAMLTGCAHGKMGVVDQNLEQGSISPDQAIFVERVSANDVQISGDKAADAVKVSDEKAQIEQRFNRIIADDLRTKGFNAQAINGQATTGLVLTGKVTRFEHGSGAARFLVGMGAGSSNLYTDFQLTDVKTKKVLSKFEVIATSGGNSAPGGFISAHMTDGAKKVADYLSKANNPPTK
jgi:hypothetical protein